MPSFGVSDELSVLAMAAIGNGLTVIVDETDAVHPFEFVTVTVYVPAVPEVIPDVVAPVRHKYVPPPLAVSVAVAPAQIIPSFGVVPELSVLAIVTIGNGFTVNVDEADAVHPFEFVTVTVYIPAVPEVIPDVVAPVLHI